MNKNNSQLINSLLIIIGGALLIFEISGSKENVYFLILGLVMLMFGLYRATNHWAVTKDDYKNEAEENSEDKTS